MPDFLGTTVMYVSPGTVYTAASGDIVAAVTPSGGPKKWRVTCAFSTSGVLSKRVSGQNLSANAGGALVAGASYVFETAVNPNDGAISFRYSVDATIREFHVEEMFA